MSLLFDRGPEMDAAEFRRISECIRNHCGLSFDQGSKFVIERRLRPRLEALGLDRFADYHARLQGSGAATELDRAVELLVTNETYFFREAYQLRAFEEEILPLVAERNAASKRISIWSAGCSTGEEVYSLAIIIRAMERFADWDVRVFGSDISRRVLRHARRGVYGPSSFRTMQPRFDHFFRTTTGGREVIPEIRSLCHFGRVNLTQREESAIVGAVDAIFCRNVLIYFDDEIRTKVVKTLYERLVPGGYLMLGHSESLFRGITDFELVHLSSDLVYQRPSLSR
ncbi:MAG: CheR family methyltransferase [Myxococcota bacterium]